MEIGEIIKTFRKSTGLNQTEFARKIGEGYSQNYVSQIEIGRKRPGFQFLEAVCDKFELPMEFFLVTMADVPENSSDEEKRLLDSIKENLFKLQMLKLKKSIKAQA